MKGSQKRTPKGDTDDGNKRSNKNHEGTQEDRQLTMLEKISRFVRQRIVWTRTFDTSILLVITANCVFIGMENPQDDDVVRKRMLQISEQVFTIIFLVEMLVKWIALGWFGSHKPDFIIRTDEPVKKIEYTGYFLDGWNVLDFIIVCSSLTVFFPDGAGANTSSIRILRVLRPLRTIAKIKELRILVETILNSLRGLADVMLLLCFLFVIFAIISLQLFQGRLRLRCYYDINPGYNGSNWEDTDPSYVYNKFYFRWEGSENPPLENSNCTHNATNKAFEPLQGECFITDLDHRLTYYAELKHIRDLGYYKQFLYVDGVGENIFCNEENKPSSTCEELEPMDHDTIDDLFMNSSLCLQNEPNPDSGLTNFDNILYSLLNVFVIITLEGWVDIMYKIQAVTHPASCIIFYLLTVVVGFFALNLCIAVIEDVYSATVEGENDDGMTDKVREFVETNMPSKRKKVAGAAERYMEDLGSALHPVSNKRNQSSIDRRHSSLSSVTRKRSGSDLIHGISYESHKHDLRQMSSFAISMAKPKEQLKVGKNSIGRIKNDPLEDAQAELAHRQKIALKALAVVQTPPDQYFLNHEHNKFIMWNRQIAQSTRFNEFVLFIIMLNTVVLAINWPTIPEEIEEKLEALNFLFTLFFTIEMIIKLIGLGIRGYISDNWNIFDGLIVIVSLIETLTSRFQADEDGGGTINALRAFRLLRVLRLLGQFESLRIILGTVITSLGDVAYLVIILLLFMFMFATLGISLFSTAFHKRQVKSDWVPLGRWRFDNIYWTMITVFQVITYDAWNQVMFDAKEATGSDIMVMYFVAIVVFGGFIVLNLFVAILLSRMSGEGEDKWAVEASISFAQKLTEDGKAKLPLDDFGQPRETKASIAFKRRLIVESLERRHFNRQQKRKMKKTKSNRDKHEIQGKSLGIFGRKNKFRKLLHSMVINKYFDWVIDLLIIANCVFLMQEDPAHVGDEIFEVANLVFTITFILEMILKVVALGLFPYPIFAKVRWKPVADATSVKFNAYEYLTIDALDKIYQRDPQVLEPLNLHKRGVITKLNIASNGIVVVEWRTLKTVRLAFKNHELIAVYFLKEPGVHILDFVNLNEHIKTEDGLSWHQWRYLIEVEQEVDKICRAHDMTNRTHNSYLSSKWNQLDAFVVIVSILGVLMPADRFIRGVRGIRPLRIAVRIEPIKVILSALVRAVPAMLQVLIFCSSFWLVLAILGVNWFAGKFSSCYCDGEKKEYEDVESWNGGESERVLRYRWDCEFVAEQTGGCSWDDEIFNFNHVFQSLHTLFVLASMSGWNEIMYNAVDAKGIDHLPKKDQTPYAALYFVVIILVCAFFSLNLIITVVVDNFQRIKATQDGSALMTEDQRKWIMTKRVVERLGLKKNLIAPKQNWRNVIFTIVMHPLFDPLIMACIVLNTFTMCLEYYEAPTSYNKLLDGLDTFYIVVFTVEAMVKVVGLGWKQYIGSSWNKFDFFIVIVGIISLFELSGDASFNVLRLFRIGRVLRLINKAKTLRTHFLTLMYSIPSLWNIGLLILVVFFVYAVIGMHLFGTEDKVDNWEFGDEKANFQDFGNAMNTLFRVSSGDGWSDVYQRYLTDVSDESLPYVYVYFTSFFLVGALVMINLFIAVILDSFNEEKEAISREQELKTIKIWRAIWQEMDEDSKGTLPAAKFIEILKCVPKPVGFLDEAVFKEQLRQRATVGGDKEAENEESAPGPLKNLACLNDITAQPKHREVLDLLIRLNLFVEYKKLDDKAGFEWCVDYQDALLCYTTMLVELDIDIEPAPEADVESQDAAIWYAEQNDCVDLCHEIWRQRSKEQRGREVARYMVDHYYEEQPASDVGGIRSDNEDINFVSGEEHTFPIRANIELQKM